MSEPSDETDPKAKKRFPVVATLILCVLAGAGSFAFVTLDPLHLMPEEAEPVEVAAPVDRPSPNQTSFVPLDPQVISLGPNSRADHLRFSATLDIRPQYEAEVMAVKPRIADMIATYLRAVEPTMLEQPAALLTLRAQMLRRISVIVGPDRVHDLLITEFILN